MRNTHEDIYVIFFFILNIPSLIRLKLLFCFISKSHWPGGDYLTMPHTSSVSLKYENWVIASNVTSSCQG